jgi:hypothetical protein
MLAGALGLSRRCGVLGRVFRDILCACGRSGLLLCLGWFVFVLLCGGALSLALALMLGRSWLYGSRRLYGRRLQKLIGRVDAVTAGRRRAARRCATTPSFSFAMP